MPPYLISHEIWAVIWPVPLAAVLISLLLFLIYRPNTNHGKYFLVLLSFALLGIVTGLLAGLSRQAAMGAVLPAVLSLVCTLAIYLIGVGKADQAIVAICIITLSLDLLIGSFWGAELREINEREPKSVRARMKEALVEVKVREFRKELGLPEFPPTPPVKNEAD